MTSTTSPSAASYVIWISMQSMTTMIREYKTVVYEFLTYRRFQYFHIFTKFITIKRKLKDATLK